MTYSTQQKEQDPESYGLLLNIRGKEKYFPCQNLSITAHQCFIMNPEDYVKGDELEKALPELSIRNSIIPPVACIDKIVRRFTYFGYIVN